jgi:surface antigen
MTIRTLSGLWLLSALAVSSVPSFADAATAHHALRHHASHHNAAHRSAAGFQAHHARFSGRYHHRYARYAGISCVPFARAESGIVLTGNAVTWWGEAAGRYARGDVPEPGSVLNFRANQAMHLGHVAVVRSVVNSRQILIDQANWWGPGGGHGVVSRAVAVVDVSPHNDWTAVRVALGRSGSFGSVYPTYGFIYDRPEGTGTGQWQMASMSGTSRLNPAPRDLRPRRERGELANVNAVPPSQYDEVAEAPAK